MEQNRELPGLAHRRTRIPESIVQLELANLTSPAPGRRLTREPGLLELARGGSMQSAARPGSRTAPRRESDSTVHSNGDSAVVEIECRKRLTR